MADEVPNLIQLERGDFKMLSEMLCDEAGETEAYVGEQNEEKRKPIRSQVKRYGWFAGAFSRGFCSVFTLIIFIRGPWLVATVGLYESIAIFLIGFIGSLLTGICICTLASNGRFTRGGNYYLVSRTLGPSFGFLIGVWSSVYNTLAFSYNTLGMAETIYQIVGRNITSSKINDIRLYGFLISVVLMSVVFCGIPYILHIDQINMVIILTGLVDLFVGVARSPTTSLENLRSNLLPPILFGVEESVARFANALALAITGISGVTGISAIAVFYKKPQRDVKIGIFASLVLVFVIYIVLLVCYASWGTLDEIQSSSVATVAKISNWSPVIYATTISTSMTDALTNGLDPSRNMQAIAVDGILPFLSWFKKGIGKYNEPLRMKLLTFIFVQFGIATGNLGSIAKVLTTLKIGTFFFLNFGCAHAYHSKLPNFRPSFKANNFWLCVFAALYVVVVMFFINVWYSLAFAALSFLLWLYVTKITKYAQPLTDGEARIICSGAGRRIAGDYSVKLEKMGVHANMQIASKTQSLLRLLKDIERSRPFMTVKNYRPNMLILCGRPSFRTYLIDFCSMIKGGVQFVGDVLITDDRYYLNKGRENGLNRDDIMRKTSLFRDINAEISINSLALILRCNCYYSAAVSSSLLSGANSLMTTIGIGGIRPNTVVMGFPENWLKLPLPKRGKGSNTYSFYNGAWNIEEVDRETKANEYIQVVQNAILLGYSFIIVRNASPLFSTCTFPDRALSISPKKAPNDTNKCKACCQKFFVPKRNLEEILSENITQGISPTYQCEFEAKGDDKVGASDVFTEEEVKVQFPTPPFGDLATRLDTRNRMNSIDSIRFPPYRSPYSMSLSGFIDVIWTNVDGGFTCLIPHLLSLNSAWRKCKLRFLVPAHKDSYSGGIPDYLETEYFLARSSPRDSESGKNINWEERQMEDKNYQRFKRMLNDLRIDATIEVFPLHLLIDLPAFKELVNQTDGKVDMDFLVKSAVELDNGTFTMRVGYTQDPSSKLTMTGSSNKHQGGVAKGKGSVFDLFTNENFARCEENKRKKERRETKGIDVGTFHLSETSSTMSTRATNTFAETSSYSVEQETNEKHTSHQDTSSFEKAVRSRCSINTEWTKKRKGDITENSITNSNQFTESTIDFDSTSNVRQDKQVNQGEADSKKTSTTKEGGSSATDMRNEHHHGYNQSISSDGHRRTLEGLDRISAFISAGATRGSEFHIADIIGLAGDLGGHSEEDTEDSPDNIGKAVSDTTDSVEKFLMEAQQSESKQEEKVQRRGNHFYPSSEDSEVLHKTSKVESLDKHSSGRPNSDPALAESTCEQEQAGGKVSRKRVQKILDVWMSKTLRSKALFSATNNEIVQALYEYTGFRVRPESYIYASRFLRLNAILRFCCVEKTDIVFIVAPIPRLNRRPGGVMAVYEVLSDIPGVPVVLLRGTGDNVISLEV